HRALGERSGAGAAGLYRRRIVAAARGEERVLADEAVGVRGAPHDPDVELEIADVRVAGRQDERGARRERDLVGVGADAVPRGPRDAGARRRDAPVALVLDDRAVVAT